MPSGPNVKTHGYGAMYVKKKKVPGQPGTWDEKKKLEAVTTYLATGNARITSAMTKVPLPTLMQWKKKDWWLEMAQQVRESEDLAMSKKLQDVIEKSLDSVADRLENGDYMYDKKSGRMIRVPAKLRDVHKVMTDSIDKRRLLQKQPTKIVENQASMNDRLAMLANQFAQFVNKAQEIPVSEVIEGDEYIKEVLDEEVHEMQGDETSPKLLSEEPKE